MSLKSRRLGEYWLREADGRDRKNKYMITIKQETKELIEWVVGLWIIGLIIFYVIPYIVFVIIPFLWNGWVDMFIRFLSYHS